MAAEIHVRLFDRDDEVYADCVGFDLMTTGATDAEALEELSRALVAYYAAHSLGVGAPEGELKPRNHLLRIVYPGSDRDRHVSLPEPSEQVVAEHAERLREVLERLRNSS